jgi:hypothetical protein
VEDGAAAIDKLTEQFQTIVLDVWKASSKKITRKFGQFDLLGFDFMVDEDLQAKLIEVNTNPALFCDTPVQESIMPPLVESTIGFVLKTHEVHGKVDAGKMSQCANGKDVFEGGADGGGKWADFKLLVDEASGYEWAGDGAGAGGAMVSPRGSAVQAVRELAAKSD